MACMVVMIIISRNVHNGGLDNPIHCITLETVNLKA